MAAAARAGSRRGDGGVPVTALEVIRACARAGIRLSVEGEHLNFSGAPLSLQLLSDLKPRKTEILAILSKPSGRPPDRLLRTYVPAPSFAADLRERFDERAGIHEFDGGLEREEAERLALNEIET